MTPASCALVLHCHLPYVLNHGRWPHGCEWLYEAAAETYLPLIRLLDELVLSGTRPRLTIAVSPVLAEQLASGQFKTEFLEWLNQRTDAARVDRAEFTASGESALSQQAKRWEDWYTAAREHFFSLDRDIVGAFRRLADAGILEILTCGATHGYFPLLSRDETIDVQVRLAVEVHRKHFGRNPRGIWLPECAYRPGYDWPPPVAIEGSQQAYPRRGIEEILARHNIEFFVVDSSLLTGSRGHDVYLDRLQALRARHDQYSEYYRPQPVDPDRSPHQVYRVAGQNGNGAVHAFVRDPDTGELVWSGESGYPGDGNYLEFHKKRSPGGLRYWAVTSTKADLGDKREYDPERAARRVQAHADHFVQTIAGLLTEGHDDNDGRILVAPYDAELFGHWWFEGPQFLKEVLRALDAGEAVQTSHLGGFIDRREAIEEITLPEGSWGLGSNHQVWLNEQTAWSWREIYACETTTVELIGRWQHQPESRTPTLENVLTLLGRELLLLCASDWQFLITTGSATEYAEARLRGHAHDFRRLTALAERLFAGDEPTAEELAIVDSIGRRDALFAELSTEWFTDLPPLVSK